MDDRERTMAVVSQMIADGQDQATIEEFVRGAAAAKAPVAPGGLTPQRKTELQAKHAKAQDEIAALKEDPGNTLGDYASAGLHGLGDKLAGLGRGALTLGSAALSPVETVTNPSKRRELERGVDDMVTLGYGQRFADWAGRKLGDTPDQQLGATAATDAENAPGYRGAGGLLGAFLPGAANAIGGAAGKAAGQIVGGAGALPAAARTAIGYEAAAPAVAGLSAGSGGHRIEAATDAATDPSSLLLATGLGGLGGGLSGRIEQSRGAQARKFIEEQGRGAEVGLTTPGRGGVFDAELAGTEASDRGIGQAAKIGAKRIVSGLKEEHKIETSAPYRALKNQIDNSPAGQAPRDVTPIVQEMQNAVWDLETAPQSRTALQQQVDILERYRSPKSGAIEVPERQLNGLRRTLMRAAKVGMTDAPGEKEAPLRAAAFAAKQLVDQGPYADLNKFYAEGADALARKRQQVGLKRKPAADEGVDVRKVKLGLERHGQNTKTAGGDTDLTTFAAENPQLAPNVDLPELARARADLSFHLAPSHGGLIERTTGAALGPGAAMLAAAAGHGMAGVGAAGGILALQNATPIAGRLLTPLARAGGPHLAIDPLLQLALDEQRRRAEAQQRMSTGGSQ